jgi:hypothetical protein
MAAVLAAGLRAVLSHRSAAALWRIRDTARANVEVITARERRRPGIDSRRTALPADEVTVERGIPITTPARTLLDLAEVLPPHQLERAVTRRSSGGSRAHIPSKPCSHATAGGGGHKR